MAASESLFVTFGPWLQDEFGVGDAVLAATTFALGAVELGVGTVDDAHRPVGQGTQRHRWERRDGDRRRCRSSRSTSGRSRG